MDPDNPTNIHTLPNLIHESLKPIVDDDGAGTLTVLIPKGGRFLRITSTEVQIRPGIFRQITEVEVNTDAVVKIIEAAVSPNRMRAADKVRAMFQDFYPSPSLVYTYTLKDRQDAPRLRRMPHTPGALIW